MSVKQTRGNLNEEASRLFRPYQAKK